MESKSNRKMTEGEFAAWLEDTLMKARATGAITEIPDIAQFRENGPGGEYNTGMLFRFKDCTFEVSIAEAEEE